MALDLIIFIVSLATLLFASKHFTLAAERIGLSMNMSPFMVGVVIVAIGTSLPELISGIFASLEGKPEIVIGNIIGAHVSNIFFVLGITTLISKKSIKLGEEYIFIDLHFMLGSATMLVLFLFDGLITWSEGLILLIGFIVYQFYLFRSEKPKAMHTINDEDVLKQQKKFFGRDFAVIAVSAAFVFLGAKFTISSVVDIATILGVNEALIGLTVMSLGTTLPELAVSISAARAGKPEMAVGNILGSCIFNVFAVGGIASIIHPISLPSELQTISISFLIVASVFFYLLSQDKKVSRFEGMLFLLFYLIFLLKITNII